MCVCTCETTITDGVCVSLSHTRCDDNMRQFNMGKCAVRICICVYVCVCIFECLHMLDIHVCVYM